MAYIPYKLIARVKARDDGCCILCGNPESRVELIRKTQEPTMQNLICICSNCYKYRKGSEVYRYLKAHYKTGVK